MCLVILHSNSPLSGHILYHDGGYADSVSYRFRVLNLLVLVLVSAHEVVHGVSYIAKDIVQEFDGTPASTHAEDETKVDVLTFLGQLLVTHQFDDFEELLHVQVLLRSDDL